ncbi:MAG TPA: transketolase [Vicinamibacteria bacterium]|nr:transketolase [Vicinamibacteria bacterium]
MSLAPLTIADDLPALATRVRERILGLARGGGCFVGASLSCADILVHLYARVLRVSPLTLGSPDRDYLFLSKGHDVPALYGTLAELGFLDPRRLEDHLTTRDSIYWHPNRKIPGVEFHSGSLGHLLSVAMGVAVDIRLRAGRNRAFVLLGDGELDEGSVWEGALVAAGLGLENLVAIVDRNGMQANRPTEELVPLEPLAAKFEAFGWGCRPVDGHDFDALDAAFADVPFRPGRPSVLLARTRRGCGVASLEDRVDRWFAALTDDELQSLLDELHGRGPGRLRRPGGLVR